MFVPLSVTLQSKLSEKHLELSLHLSLCSEFSPWKKLEGESSKKQKKQKMRDFKESILNRKDEFPNAGENQFTGAEPVLPLGLFCGPLRRPLGSHRDAAPSAAASRRGGWAGEGVSAGSFQPPLPVYDTRECSSSCAGGVFELREGLDWGSRQTFSRVSVLALSQLPLPLADHRHGAAEDPAPGVVLAAGGGRWNAGAPVPRPANGVGRRRRRGQREGVVAVPLHVSGPLTSAGGGGGAGGGSGGVQRALRAGPLEAGVGGAEHLGGGHPEAGLGAAPLPQEQGLEGVAAGGGLAEVSLDGASLTGQGRPCPRGRAGGGRRWGLRLAPRPGLVFLRLSATQDLPLWPVEEKRPSKF